MKQLLKRIVPIGLTVLVVMLVFVTPAFAHEGVGGDELASADIMLIMAVAFAALGGIAILMSINNGELRDPEAAKYEMMATSLTNSRGEDLERYVTIEEE